MVYLDDGWCTASSFNECKSVADSVNDLSKAGLVPNIEKSLWVPVQCIDWLGLTWNEDKSTLKVIERRVDDLLSCIADLTEVLPYVTARRLAVFTGKVISFMPVTGHVSQLKTRFSYMTICEKKHWDRVFRLPSDSAVIEELFFWKNVTRLNSRNVLQYSLPQVLFYCDASHSGCGAWAECGDMKFNYAWTDTEKSKSSTWRELKGIALALIAFSPRLRGKCIKVFSDNKGVDAMIKKGSMRSDLHNLSIEIDLFCRSHNIKLQVQWIPRELNVEADILSREIDFDDWSVSQVFFNFMEQLWGPHTVDRFADNFNAKLVKFNSKYWCPNTSQVDAFSVPWGSEMNWLVPPISLLGKAIKHVKASKARATYTGSTRLAILSILATFILQNERFF